jgi:hypothetical protein
MDRAHLRRVLVDLRVAFDDLKAVIEDMRRPPRERELGPVLHGQHCDEAYEKIDAAVAHLLRATEEPPEGGGEAVH